MDRKRCRKGKHVLFYAACVILLGLMACAPLKETVVIEGPGVCEHQEFLQGLSAPADFEAAVQNSQETLSASPRSQPADDALFHLGLVYAHPDYPRKDYKKSLGYFKRLLKEFPQSPLVEEARVWAGILEDMIRVTKVDIEIEEKKKELRK